jgi:hypothetical protein
MEFIDAENCRGMKICGIAEQIKANEGIGAA